MLSRMLQCGTLIGACCMLAFECVCSYLSYALQSGNQPRVLLITMIRSLHVLGNEVKSVRPRLTGLFKPRTRAKEETIARSM